MNANDRDQARITFRDGSYSPSNRRGVLEITLDSENATVSLKQTAGWGVTCWSAKLPLLTWKSIVDALKMDGFPQQPRVDTSPKLPGTSHRTLVVESGRKTVELSLHPQRGDYGETVVRLFSIVSQIAPGILGGTAASWWIEGTVIEEPTEVRDPQT